MAVKRQLRVLLDTNVWLDFFLRNRRGRETAEKLIRRGIRDDVCLLYPSQSVLDVFYQVGLAYKRLLREDGVEIDEAWGRAINAQAWEAVNMMREAATVVGMDESDLWLAFKYRELNSDLEDNLVLAAAERAHADYLVSSDARLIAKASVPALSPEDMLAYLQIWDDED